MSLPEIFATAFGDYRRDKSTGPREGGSGIVVKAVLIGDPEEVVAIKILTAETTGKLARFRNEIAFCRRIDHPNIVRVMADGLTRDGDRSRPFYVMPFYEQSLRDVIKAIDH